MANILRRPMLLTFLLVLACAAGFMTLGAQGAWSFVLPFRGTKLLALVLVGTSISVSTVLFATITNNRILTPSLMGFDALYLLVQTTLAFLLGATEATKLSPQVMFLGQVALMVALSTVLFRWLFLGSARSLHLVLLVGLITGGLFRSLSTFLQRLLSPNDFVVLQDQLFASFNTVHGSLLTVSAVIVISVLVWVWRRRYVHDVLSLGRDQAINLGVDYRAEVTKLMVSIALLVSVSTALVGPVTFFGLLVANLAYQLAPSYRHRDVLPMAAMIAGITLIGGQTVLERVLGFDTALSIVVEFLGGIVFIALLLKGSRR